jgi:hypothetical protein
MQGDSVLVERLLDGSIGAAEPESRKAAFEEVVKAYSDACRT